jgi:ABC-type antimicrobial peptide transport system permease subunit
VLDDEVKIGSFGAHLAIDDPLLAWLSGIAMLLTIIGTYGVAAHAIARRTKEIAVRLALGAPERAIVHLIVRFALIPTIAGILVGLGAGAAAAVVLERFVFGFEPSRATAYVSAGLLPLSLALVCSSWPARRAARIPPADSLRAE